MHNHLARASRIDVLGTDIDRAGLALAERSALRRRLQTPPGCANYFSQTPPFTIVPEIRRLVRFERRDLLEELPKVPGGFQLISCRIADLLRSETQGDC
jgi:chemotaxis methyl-accepting protein methylase